MDGGIAIGPDTIWGGCVDWNVRDFHGYATHRGTSYNAYLLLDEHPTLIDGVKAPFAAEGLRKIAAHIDPARIAYIIVNHGEPDHAGSIPAVVAAAPRAKVLATKKGVESLRAHHGGDWDFEAVDGRSELAIGRRTLRFLPIPMVHWPDSMVTYDATDRVLFSSDAFGQHLASSARFADELPPGLAFEELRRYYANILMGLGRPVSKALRAVAGLGIDAVLPAHGVGWRRDFPRVLEAYGRWARGQCVPKVTVVYDTMWGATDRIARALGEGIAGEGVGARLLHVRRNDLTEIAAEILDSPATAVGSPTLNNRCMPAIAAFLNYIGGLRPPGGRAALAFGTHGWRGGGAAQIARELEDLGFDLIAPPLTAAYSPDEAILETAREKGKALAGEAKARAKAAEAAG